MQTSILGILLTFGSVATAADPPVEAAKSGTASEALDDELADLGLEKTDTLDERSLDIYGFSDFTFRDTIFNRTRARLLHAYSYFPYPTFSVGNINLYLDAKLSSRWRSLIEIRFLYLPNGAPQPFNPDGTQPRWDTSVQDFNDENRSNFLRWGGISIERVHIEYKFHDLLNVMAGQFLTPYGIWNVDHGSPTLIAVDRPTIVGDNLFPERQTGLQFYGVVPVQSALLGYHLTVSNGRGPIDTYRDLDNDKAMGGRLYLRSYWLGEMILGVSAYTGGSTNRENKAVPIPVNGEPAITYSFNISEQYRETSFAGDLRWEWHDLVFLGEILVNDRVYNDKTRPTVQFNLSKGLQPDFRRWGGYALLGYHSPWFGLMPFVLYAIEYFGQNPGINFGYQFITGVNWHLNAPVVLKAQWDHLGVEGRTDFYKNEFYNRFTAQITYLF